MTVPPSPRPGRPSTHEADLDDKAYLLGYDPSAYPPFAVAVDLAVFTVLDGLLQLLLVERREPPYRGLWALPGGFVRPDESIDGAARRELAEETGLTYGDGHLEQLATYGNPDRDPRMRVVSVAYVALLHDVSPPIAGGDAADAHFWPVVDLDLSGAGDDHGLELAFDHVGIVGDAIERVRSKLEYTTLAGSFVREPFSLADLRRVYGAVWGTAPDVANFRRKVLATPGFVVPTDESRAAGDTGGRPAALYRLGPATRLSPPLLRGGTGHQE